jgi:hypothetical protein
MTKCKKCQGEMKTGEALNNPVVEGNEGHGTRSQANSDAVIEVLKCVDCGHSFVPTFSEWVVFMSIKRGIQQANEVANTFMLNSKIQ